MSVTLQGKADLHELLLNMELLLPPLFLSPGGFCPIVEHQSAKLDDNHRCDLRCEQYSWISDMSMKSLVLKSQGW